MDCKSASAAERVSDWGAGVQWPNERKPIFFMQDELIVTGHSTYLPRRPDSAGTAMTSMVEGACAFHHTLFNRVDRTDNRNAINYLRVRVGVQFIVEVG